MKPGQVLFEVKLPDQLPMRLVTIPFDTPRGNRIQLEVGDRATTLIEGHAKQLGLALRRWVKAQKFLRGDTPRGRRAL